MLDKVIIITNILAYVFDQESECTEVLTNLFEMNIHCLKEPYVLYSIHSATTKPSDAFTLWNSTPETVELHRTGASDWP